MPLDEPLQLGLSYDDAVPGPVTLTFEQLHALHAVLTTLPAATIWPEPEFVERVGDFRETVLRMAGLLRGAFREQPVAEGALRAAHTLLVTLLALLPSERVFMERTGHYRDHVTAVAYGLRRAASGQ